jgi:hypothetical protein
VRNSRNSRAVWLTAAALVAATAALSAHRKDEYLQAARLAIDPGRVQIELDLTPGIAVAEDVLRAIDLDRNGALTPAETSAYATSVMRDISLDVDGQPLSARVLSTDVPGIESVRRGEGTIRLQLAASLPPLTAGGHQIRYRNAHRPDVGVYLANALVPSTDRVAVTGQERDVDQRELRVDYRLRGATAAGLNSWSALPVLGGLIALGAMALQSARRRRRGATDASDPLRAASQSSTPQLPAGR